MPIGERIKCVRKQFHETQASMGNKLGILGTAISLIENGERNPSEPVIRAICREYHVRYDWLVNGEGEMKEPSGSGLIPELTTVMMRYPDLESLLVSVVDQMTDADWRRINELVQGFIKKGRS